ncbi:MAG: hypothetical protein J2P24_05910 [Streptosporangiales bacterium]|nr:hypothetical protein [Streptosporangiales bacterium]MBO0890638.1 hypothetical protein [Acidothermales bacterium]
MGPRERQLVGLLFTGVVLLVTAVGFGVGYVIGFARTSGAAAVVPARPVPADVCGLLSDETRTHLVPSGARVRLPPPRSDTAHAVARCRLRTVDRNAQTYNRATLTVTAERFGARADATGARAARAAMSLHGYPVHLGDASACTVETTIPHQWNANLQVQYGDTLVTVNYSTWLATKDDTKAAAMAVARETLAGLK